MQASSAGAVQGLSYVYLRKRAVQRLGMNADKAFREQHKNKRRQKRGEFAISGWRLLLLRHVPVQ